MYTMARETHMKRKRQKTEKAEPEQAALDPGEIAAAYELPPEITEFIESLQQERDDAISGRQRAMADFLNFQKRAARTSLVRARMAALASFAHCCQPSIILTSRWTRTRNGSPWIS